MKPPVPPDYRALLAAVVRQVDNSMGAVCFTCELSRTPCRCALAAARAALDGGSNAR